VLDADQVASLVERKDGAGGARFPNGSLGFVFRAAFGRLSSEQIEAEAKAQIRKLQATGITVSHLDTHKHTHILPQVWSPLLRAAQACGVRRIRNPFEPVRLSLLRERSSLWKRFAQVKFLSGLARRFRQAVLQAGMWTPDGTFGIVTTGWMDERLLKFMVEHLADGTWELVCHPGYNDAQLGAVKTRLRASREQELRLLTSADLLELLTRHGIELISYNAPA
jgi:chitin disaccharide deacetylase